MRIGSLIGIDEWFIYARARDGRVVYTIVELISEWLSAPHKGEGSYGSVAWREDWEYIFATVRDNAHTFVWHEVGDAHLLAISDADFARQSARSHFREGVVLNSDAP